MTTCVLLLTFVEATSFSINKFLLQLQVSPCKGQAIVPDWLTPFSYVAQYSAAWLDPQLGLLWPRSEFAQPQIHLLAEIGESQNQWSEINVQTLDITRRKK